jgi:hypothetical protein
MNGCISAYLVVEVVLEFIINGVPIRIRAVSLRVCGSRYKTRSLNIKDGAGVP